jgi:hypothetical protein
MHACAQFVEFPGSRLPDIGFLPRDESGSQAGGAVAVVERSARSAAGSIPAGEMTRNVLEAGSVNFIGERS